MSRENVEVVRRRLEAWSSGDLDATLASMAPELEFRTSGVFPDMGPVYQGHDGFKRYWNDFRAAWEEIEHVPERLLDHGDRVVVLLGPFRFRLSGGLLLLLVQL